VHISSMTCTKIPFVLTILSLGFGEEAGLACGFMVGYLWRGFYLKGLFFETAWKEREFKGRMGFFCYYSHFLSLTRCCWVRILLMHNWRGLIPALYFCKVIEMKKSVDKYKNESFSQNKPTWNEDATISICVAVSHEILRMRDAIFFQLMIQIQRAFLEQKVLIFSCN